MSKDDFERHVRESLRDGRVKFTTAKYTGEAVILTNRLADMDAKALAEPHSEVACDKCGEMCILHPLSLPQTPAADVVCGHCAPLLALEGLEIRANPAAVIDLLLARWGKR